MGNHILEYIGAGKIITTNMRETLSRWKNPQPGDVVDFSKMGGVYPFDKSKFGTIDSIDNQSNKISICSHMGSIFLGDGYVSISGGPFEWVSPSRLEGTYQLRTQRMWNWGNNTPGAGMGVDYLIDRPVFILLPKS